ncbi:MAG: MotA/TolQ/ExbB proton channel family protein [Mariprofundales bacterium]
MNAVLTFFNQGGVVMWILLGCSLLAVTIIFKRGWELRRSAVLPLRDVAAIEQAVRNGKVNVAVSVCEQRTTAMHRILLIALQNRGVSRPVMKEIIEETGRQEVAQLEKHIDILGVIAAIAPLLGLLGTVIGMMDVFQDIAMQGTGKSQVLAGGISKALNTTAAGLTVAIPAFVAHRWFETRVDNFVIEIEQYAIRFVELLKGER